MWHKSILAVGLAAGVIHLSESAGAQENEQLRALCDRYWQAVLEHHPTRATALGDYRYADRLDDLSQSGRKEWEQALIRLQVEARKIRERGLSLDDRLTHDLLERTILDDLTRSRLPLYMTPLDPLDGPHIRFPLILVSQPFGSKADFVAYLARLRAFPKQIADVISNMRQGIKLGWVSPRGIAEKVVPQIRVHIVSNATNSEFYSPLRQLAKPGVADGESIQTQLVDAIKANVVPAYLRLLTFVEDEYLPRCRSTVGIGSLPHGDSVYKILVRLHTTVPDDPDKIHDLGLREVARIRTEMAGIQNEVGFQGSLNDFLEHMRAAPKYRFRTGEELVRAADAILSRTKPLLPELFGRLPKAKCVMKEIESFRSSASPVAYYNPAPADGSRPGYYYINTFAPEDRLRFTLEALTYHEAVPGHHLQYMLDQENERLPRFRRYGSYTAYGEGWALYSEKLGYELGGYRTPLDRFGQLTFEMWRACRLVVDTGIHSKDWPRQRAIDYLASKTSLAMIDIEAEIDRYISWPGQALAYKIGELRILELRRQAEKRLGELFDLRDFHDALLSEGSMPINMLEKRMREWIAQRESAPGKN